MASRLMITTPESTNAVIAAASEHDMLLGVALRALHALARRENAIELSEAEVAALEKITNRAVLDLWK